MLFGIMQGRLLPPIENRIQCFPKNSWSTEFSLASSLGFSAIEWIYEGYGAEENPLATNAGIAQIKELASKHRVKISSLCADYFMNYPFLRCNEVQKQERIEKLKWLIQQSHKAGISSIVLPFVDNSKIKNESEIPEVITILKEALPSAKQLEIELHLETDLSPQLFSNLLNQLPDPSLKVNYDSGNSASLGYSILEEFSSYGKRIGSIHIKDRMLGGSTVPLGQGNVNFFELNKMVKLINYQRPLILQVARGTSGDEVNWIKDQIQFLKKHINLEN